MADAAWPSPFIGRADELEQLTARLAAVRAGAGGVVLVAGEPGIGKTRLVEAALERHVGPVAWGTCAAEDGVPPFWPWRQVLRRCAGQAQDCGVDVPQQELRLLTEDVVEQAPPDGASRYRLFETVTSTLAAAGRDAGLVVVLDDLQWADEASVRLLQVVASQARRLPVLLVCTYRDTELDPRGPLGAALPDLARSGLLVVLQGLSAAELCLLHRSLRDQASTPDDEEQLGLALLHRTGGNPLFAQEVLRLLFTTAGAAAAVELASGAVVSGTVRAVLERRLARLPQRTYDVLSWAAVDGPGLDVDVLAEVTGRSRDDVLRTLDPAVAAKVVRMDDGGQLAFAHDLLRETLVETLPLSERVHRHWCLGRAQPATSAGDITRTSRRAGHLVAGAAAGDAEEAAQWAVRAAEQAHAVLAHEQSAAWYRRALAVRRTAIAGDSAESALLLAAGSAELAAGQLAAARESFLAAARAARARGDPELLAAAALGLAGPAGFEVPLFDQVQIDLLEEALAAQPAPDSRVRAQLLSRLSVALAFVDDADRRRLLSEQALETGRRLHDDEVCAYALAVWCDTVSGPDDVGRRLDAAGEVVRLAAATGARPLELLGRRLRVVALLERGRLAEAAVEVSAFDRLAQVLRQPQYSWYVPLWRAALAMAAGDLDASSGLTAQAARLGAAAGSANAGTLVTVQRFVQLRSAGRFAEAATLAAELLAAVPDIAAPEALEGASLVVDVVTGDVDRARRRADALVVRGLRTARADSEWLPDVAQLAEAAVALRHEPLARLVLEGLTPYESLFVVEGIGAAVLAPAAHYLAQAARVLGRDRDAERWADRAAQSCSAAGLLLVPPPLTVGPAPVAVPDPPAGRPAELRREGEVWAVTYAGSTARLRDSKGLRDLALLLQLPGRAVHVTELTGAPVGSTAEDLDATAVAAYRRRLSDLEEEITSAREDCDVSRSSGLAAERDFLVSELAGALGLAGRRRRAGDPVERSRKAVTARVRDSIERISLVHPVLGRHLTNSVRTGTWCCYDPERPVTWRLS